MRRCLPFLLLVGCVTPPPPPPALPPPPSIARIYGNPPLTSGGVAGPKWRPHSTSLTFVEGSKLIACDAATGTRTTLLDFSTIGRGDDGATPRGIGRNAAGRYWWNERGDTLLLHHRGGLWSWNNGEATLLTTTKGEIHDPKWALNAALFIREHNLWIASPGVGDRALTKAGSATLLNGELDWVYPEELGISSATWPRPDGTRFAFLQLDQAPVAEFPLTDYRPRLGEVRPMRYPKAGDPNPVPRIGIVDLAGEIVWADLGAEKDIYIPRAAWRPDGQLIVERLNRAQTQLDVLSVDPATGKSTLIFEEKDAGWVDVSELEFAGEELLWFSERDGRRHLYLVSGDGSSQQLTKGEWDVHDLLGHDAEAVYYLSDEGDRHQRHAWKQPLKGGERTRLTSEPGCHQVQMSPACDFMLDSFSSLGVPPKTVIRDMQGRITVTFPAKADPALADYLRAKTEFVGVKAGDVELDAMITRPPDFDPKKKYPVLIHTYGGPGSQLVLDRWGGGNAFWHAALAARGIIVFSVDGQGGGGHGAAWTRRLLKRMGQVELESQLHGVAWLKSQPWVDPARIGIWGWSYGGYMTCYALTHSDAFACGIAVAPVTDWRFYDTIYTERYLKLPKDNEEGYKSSSPVNDAAKLSGRLLLVHGTDDDNVHFQNSVVFTDKLIEARKPFDFMMYPGKAHGIGGESARVHLFEMMTDFLVRNLKP